LIYTCYTRRYTVSELINSADKRKELLKHMILQLHKGEDPEEVRKQLVQLLGEIPYNEVVEVEQELISEGLPVEEVQKLCDVHTQALKGAISRPEDKDVPPGHPVHTFLKENAALGWEISSVHKIFKDIESAAPQHDATAPFLELRQHFNLLMDVDKHYRKKENLLFPFLEKYGVTGPSKVMWGKHDEARELLKKAQSVFAEYKTVAAEKALSIINQTLRPAVTALEEMCYKEEEILFPMALEKLSESEWHDIYLQSNEIGYCLYGPKVEWKPESREGKPGETGTAERIQLPSGTVTVEELTAILDTIPFDLTFVDKDDTVRYFTEGTERIFDRNRAIIGRKVQMCHPPASVHIVEQMLEDFKSGKRNRARFWITLQDRFIMIEYHALRNKEGTYLGTLEVSQDLTEKRALEGEQRILSYGADD
jgi:DUF438 domain-containing protein